MAVFRSALFLFLIGVFFLEAGCKQKSAPPATKSATTATAAEPVKTTPPVAATDKTTKPTAAPDKADANKKDAKEDEASDDSDDADGPAPPDSWKDPRVLAELAKSCAFNPEALPEKERRKWIRHRDEGDPDSALSCTASMEQSCIYDPCYDEQSSKCNPRCTSKCQSCGGDCASKCETCKTPCQDDACRMACAKKCASCHESCVRKRDRCATGTCTEEYKKCRQKLHDEWIANGCPEICTKMVDCKTECREKNEKSKKERDCDKLCTPKSKAADKCNLLLCQGDDGMGVNPETLD